MFLTWFLGIALALLNNYFLTSWLIIKITLVILMSGLQGSGKTTFSGKLANYLKTKKSKQVLLVGCDVYRPAAINQLQVVGEQIGVEVYAEVDNQNPVEISQNAIKHA